MVAARTTDDLVAEVDDQALLPSADGRLTSAEKLRLADRVMRTVVSDLLVSARSGWWVTAATDASIVNGTYLYAVPQRALAEGVTDVLIVDGDREWSAPELSVPEAHRYRDRVGPWDGSPYAFTWRDDKIELLPHPSQAGSYTLRILYPRRPPSLVTVASCAAVASAVGTTITTAATVPSAWGSSETLDVISATNGRPRGEDVAGTSIATTNVTVAAGVPSGTVAGDYVCLAGQTCVPPVPGSVWDVLVDGTTLEVLRALEDPGIANAERRYTESVMRARNILEPRSRGSVKKIVARHSPLRRGRGY